MAAPTLPLELKPGSVLLFEADQSFYENGCLQAETPKQMLANHPTSAPNNMTNMVPTEPFTYVFNGQVMAFRRGRSYPLPTPMYAALLADGQPVTAGT